MYCFAYECCVATMADEGEGGEGESKVAELLEQKELNRKRKELVVSEFVKKYKQTEAERRRLDRVKVLLNRLDSDLAANINILRAQIEEEDRTLAAARAEFQRAEKEYVRTKAALERSSTKKRLLTEHLDLIILSNEREKAHKLAQLMDQLGVQDAEDLGRLFPMAGVPSDVAAAAVAEVNGAASAAAEPVAAAAEPVAAAAKPGTAAVKPAPAPKPAPAVVPARKATAVARARAAEAGRRSAAPAPRTGTSGFAGFSPEEIEKFDV